MPKEEKSRGGSAAENAVLDEVWKEVGGELVQEFMVPTVPRQPRRIDGIFVLDDPRRPLPPRAPSALRGRDVVLCQAKAGRLDLGVLGQTLFSAELIREYAPRNLRLIAAAAESDPFVERMLDSYRPLKWCRAEPDAIILPDRKPGEADAKVAAAVRTGEPVVLVYTSRRFYMTTMGRAVFGVPVARDLLGLADVKSYFCYRNDNAVLRKLIEQLPNIIVQPG